MKFIAVAIVFAAVVMWRRAMRRAGARRVAAREREYAAELRESSAAALRDQILRSDYWDLAASAPLRETPMAREFLRRFTAERYAELLTELGGGEYMCGVFAAAERSIGYRARPMIMDYDQIFIPVLRELRRRQLET